MWTGFLILLTTGSFFLAAYSMMVRGQALASPTGRRNLVIVLVLIGFVSGVILGFVAPMLDR